MKILIKTYGCQMNDRDSEALAALLRARGHTMVAAEAEAEAVVVNTCSVRDKAEQKALGKLRDLSARRRGKDRLVIGAVGCMAQRLGLEMTGMVHGLDFVLGTRRLWSLPDVLARISSGEGPIVDVGEGRNGEPPCGHEHGAVTAMVVAMRGCDRRCSYCVVPEVRGPEESRTTANIVAEVTELVSHGAREVTLIGQSITAYGRGCTAFDGAPPSKLGLTEAFPRLLEIVAGIPGLARLRFATSHPSGCTGELATAMASLPQVCEHLHMPIQSGSNRILGLMRRGYTAEEYKRAVSFMRAAVPGIAVTTDIIVGFPSETSEDFECTRRLMEETGFDNAFMFKYSPRPGTVAAGMVDDVAQAEKARRLHILLEEQGKRSLAVNMRHVGNTVEVLVEGASSRSSRSMAGRTRTNRIVIMDDAGGAAAGDMVDVAVEIARPQTLHGRVVAQVAPGGGKRGA